MQVKRYHCRCEIDKGGSFVPNGEFEGVGRSNWGPVSISSAAQVHWQMCLKPSSTDKCAWNQDQLKNLPGRPDLWPSSSWPFREVLATTTHMGLVSFLKSAILTLSVVQGSSKQGQSDREQLISKTTLFVCPQSMLKTAVSACGFKAFKLKKCIVFLTPMQVFHKQKFYSLLLWHNKGCTVYTKSISHRLGGLSTFSFQFLVIVYWSMSHISFKNFWANVVHFCCTFQRCPCCSLQ